MKKILILSIFFCFGISPLFASTGDNIWIKKKFGPFSGNIVSFQYGNNTDNFAFLIKNSEKKYKIIKNGEPVQGYLSTKDPLYSLKGNHFAFVGQKVNRKYVVVRDGSESRELQYAPFNLSFSVDGTHLSYFLWGENGIDVIMDEVKIGEFGGINGSVEFSADSSSYAINGNDNSGAYIFKDGKIIDRDKYKELSTPVYSATGSRFVFVALKNNSKYVVVENNVESKEYDEIFAAPVFSPDGKRLSFIASTDGKWMVVTDGKEGKQYESSKENYYTSISDLTYSPDSTENMYTAYKSGKAVLVKNSVEIAGYDGIYSPRYLSHTSEGFIFIAQKGDGSWVIVKNNVEIPSSLGAGVLSTYHDQSIVYTSHFHGTGRYILMRDNKKILGVHNKISLLGSAWGDDFTTYAFTTTVGNKNYLNVWVKK